MKKILFICLLISTILSAKSEAVLVELPTKDVLCPVYLSKIQASESYVSSDYIKRLEEILYLDFERSGKMTILKRTPELEKCLANSETPGATLSKLWKKQKAAYVIYSTVTHNKLSIFAFSTSGELIKQYKNLPLSGTLSKDRKLIHRLSDAIFEAFFHTKGIASTRLLYTIQFPKKLNGALEWTSEIWESDYDGANKRQITEEQDYAITPVFYPQTTSEKPMQFLYVSYSNGLPKIYISPIEQPNGKEFISLPGNQLLPAISKKGNKIAFISDAGGRADLFIQGHSETQGLIGKPIQAYSFPNSVQASPTFNPDGSKIAFVSDKQGTPRIYLMDTPTSSRNNYRKEITCLTKLHKENTSPSWSPDGEKLAYSAKINGVRQIFIFDFVSQKEIQLTTGPGHKENPCWARNSLHLVFNSVDKSMSELFMINLQQKEIYQITDGPGKKHYPAWEP